MRQKALLPKDSSTEQPGDDFIPFDYFNHRHVVMTNGCGDHEKEVTDSTMLPLTQYVVSWPVTFHFD